MKTKHLFRYLAIVLLLTACGNSVKPITPTPVDPDPPIVDPDPEEALKLKKQAAIYELENFVDFKLYREEQKNELNSIIETGKKVINACTTADDIDEILELYEGYIMEVKTDKQLKREAYDKCESTDLIDNYKKLGYSYLYQDPNYKKGYIVSKPTYGEGENPLHEEYLKTYSWNPYTPKWSIAQWTSRYDIMGNGENDGYTLTQDIDGVINTYTSKGKIVNNKFVPGKVITANSKTGELYLECNTSVEYEKHRTGSEGWVHLLYGQDFEDNLVRVCEQKSIIMEASFTINKCINHMGSAYDTNKHCAQLCWYITIQNRAGGYSNPDYGKYIWFGIQLWDNRTAGKVAGMYRAHDAGTDTLIYNPSTEGVYTDNAGKQPLVNQKATARIDIVSYVQEAFEYAKNNGYLGNTKFEDLYIGGTNFGYEVPGTFDIASTIHGINVFYKNK